MTGRRPDPEALYFLPLGGSGEIGMNLNLYRHAGKWIMVDLGVTFADASLPGIDLVLPDISFIEERRDDLLAIVLTHAHEDHFGAVPYLWPRLRCPVYATAFTAELLRAKLAEAGLLGEVPLHEVDLGGSISLGPFDVTYITLTHSILEPNALEIRTSAGTVLHTGDWKIDPQPLIGDVTDEAKLREIGEAGVLAMVCDSTNVFNPGESGSESMVRDNLTRIIGDRQGRVAVTAFASNVTRIQSIAEAGAANGRHIVLVGRSMKRTVAAARATGYLEDLPPLLDEDEGAHLPPDRVLYICTGSQGEVRGAMARIAAGDHPRITLESGDTVIFSSRQIPGNERTIFALYNRFALRGIEIVTERDDTVHVSGHPCRDELAQMYQWVNPGISVPVHGEARHLFEHARFARSLQVPTTVVPENGSVVRLGPGKAEIVDHVPSGRLVVDGSQIVPADGAALVERRRLLYHGYLGVSLAVDGAGALLAEPGIAPQGVPWEGDSEEFTGAIRQAVEAALAALSARQRRDDAQLSEAARIAARRAARQLCGKRPITVVQVMRIGNGEER